MQITPQSKAGFKRTSMNFSEKWTFSSSSSKVRAEARPATDMMPQKIVLSAVTKILLMPLFCTKYVILETEYMTKRNNSSLMTEKDSGMAFTTNNHFFGINTRRVPLPVKPRNWQSFAGLVNNHTNLGGILTTEKCLRIQLKYKRWKRWWSIHWSFWALSIISIAWEKSEMWNEWLVFCSVTTDKAS